ncbi:P-loop containing nucleoside triphosphate hydrolase protein [Ceraceosorus guamensis]|uniref:P-loop containing nucleoside triphosphate hydrolase protein n=1 Tax=Ceraceosorus guamensis TaxID=1522189 RepID=A0A316W1P7_9BASI|nr:P-loop containing nucleoside triphosphate hydrolase protein [Ceraceosorus guamensis]PWN43817.1 P-loop containing nucleoside triphosphate hydrolase protein [Ceraceosorus guamensis]
MEFTDRAQAAVGAALQLAKDFAHPQVRPEHLALAFLNDDARGTSAGALNTFEPSRPSTPSSNKPNASESLFRSVLGKAGVDASRFEFSLRNALKKIASQNPAPDEVGLAGSTSRILKEADHLKTQQHDSFIAADHILLALLTDSSTVKLLKEAGLANENLLKTAITQSRGQRRVDSRAADDGLADAVSKYCVDLTALASEGKLDPVIGRDEAIRRVIRILSQRRKANAVLVGPPGTGKTAICEGLAQRVIDNDVPPQLQTKVLSLDLAALVAGASYKGQFEERWKALLTELEKMADNGKAPILFIDEVHLLVAGGGNGSTDGGNLLKPSLARGKLRVVAATTPSEYRTTIEKDGALDRRFQMVNVDEPNEEETIAIMRGLRERYENHHGLRILDSALVAAAKLARRYLSGRKCPDSAIDLLDEACAEVRVSRETLPPEIDSLQREVVRLEVAIHALEREKDDASKEALEHTRKQLAVIKETLAPKMAAYEAEKEQAERLSNARRRLEELRQKAEKAQRMMDVATASDLTYGAIPDLEARIAELEAEEKRKAERGESDKGTVGPEQIAATVARWTGIPVASMLESERDKVLQLPKLLKKEVIGQPEATNAIAKAIQLQRAGLANPNSPPSFLFCGPSGAGKTLCAKTLAKILFGTSDALIRIDASEYSERHSISRLLGAPPGYVGYEQGGALEAVRRKPYSVILVDELEKAAREFHMTFLQALDDGRLTDGQGRVIDLRNSIIIFTSNLGSAFISDNETTLDNGKIAPATRQLVEGAIAAALPPELRNRFSATVLFRPLSRKDVRNIIDLRIEEVHARIRSNGKQIRLVLSEEAKDVLAKLGYNPQMGARPLTRVITNEILSPLSVLMLRGAVLDKEEVRVDADVAKDRLVVRANHEANEMEVDDEEDGESYLMAEEVD